MTTEHDHGVQPLWADPETDPDAYPGADTTSAGLTTVPTVIPVADEEPLRPINWNLLTAEEAEAEWLDLNAWVNWLRRTYGLPPTVIPPLWHRHDELVWELSALHQHWLQCYDPDSSASAPLAWHRDFADARNRLREWVATSGTRLDRDRPTRRTSWPGEDSPVPTGEREIEHRDRDFVAFVGADVAARRQVETTLSESSSH
jgi:hypothetical protein